MVILMHQGKKVCEAPDVEDARARAIKVLEENAGWDRVSIHNPGEEFECPICSAWRRMKAPGLGRIFLAEILG